MREPILLELSNDASERSNSSDMFVSFNSAGRLSGDVAVLMQGNTDTSFSYHEIFDQLAAQSSRHRWPSLFMAAHAAVENSAGLGDLPHDVSAI